jgi:hypothetical protein
MTRLNVSMNGKALFFKTIDVHHNELNFLEPRLETRIARMKESSGFELIGSTEFV